MWYLRGASGWGGPFPDGHSPGVALIGDSVGKLEGPPEVLQMSLTISQYVEYVLGVSELDGPQTLPTEIDINSFFMSVSEWEKLN